MSLFGAHREAGSESLPVEGHLPDFGGATGWLNSEPLTPQGLRGRVVLVDFWTYTCINWLRTLPYLRAWEDKYGPEGLTVIGVHTPEFGFEHDVDNVVRACRDLGVAYPIALDNDYGVWRAFDNHYWPAVYVADGDGRIRYHHFGEGEYAMTEMVLQHLVASAGAEGIDPALVSVDASGIERPADWHSLWSSETYLGAGRTQGFASPDGAWFGEPHTFGTYANLALNEWAPSGSWTLDQHAAVSNQPGGRIAYRFHARDLNLVMGPATRGTSNVFRVSLDDGSPGEAHGVDIDADGNGTLHDQRLYQLIRQPDPVAERLFEIEFLDTGAEAYCFTFG